MKLATLRTSSRDGQLLIVSHDLTKATKVPEIAMTLQQALDNWEKLAPSLEKIYKKINAGEGDWFPFNSDEMTSPLPRAYQWLDGSAYLRHVELVRKARGVEMPENFWREPLMYQGGSDAFLGPHEDIPIADETWGADFEAEVAVIVDDVQMSAIPTQSKSAIRLLMIVNDVSLRNLIPPELAKGFGFLQGKPSSAFSPVAVTPDELGAAWDGYKIHLPIIIHLNGHLFGKPNAGKDMNFDFPTLITHAAYTRPLSAGTIIGSGTISNIDNSAGSACIAEVRMLETLNNGKPHTPFMRYGDKVRIEMLDAKGQSIFGAIEQTIVPYKPK